MRSFLEQYGTAIFTLVLIVILIAFAGPVGNIIKTNVNTQIQKVNEIGSSETTIAARDLLEPKEAVDKVYCILYDDGELTISQTEITPDENRTVLNKGYFTRPKDVDITEGKQHIITARFVGGVKPKNCNSFFNNCTKLTKINNIENLYTNKCVDMNYMFYNCQSLITLDLSTFNTNNVMNMAGMFSACENLTNLNISSFDTSKVTNMSWMFHSTNLINLDLNSFNMSNVSTTKGMFHNSNSLTSITCPESVKDKIISMGNTNIPSTITWNII